MLRDTFPLRAAPGQTARHSRVSDPRDRFFYVVELHAHVICIYSDWIDWLLFFCPFHCPFSLCCTNVGSDSKLKGAYLSELRLTLELPVYSCEKGLVSRGVGRCFCKGVLRWPEATDKSGGPGAKFWHSTFPQINSEQIWYSIKICQNN